MLGVRRKGLCHDNIGGKREIRALGFQGGEHLLAFFDELGLSQRFSDLLSGRQQERIGDAAPHDKLIHLLRKVIQNGELRRHLAAAHDGHQGMLSFLHGLREGVDFSGHQGAGAGHFRQARHAFRRSLRAVRGAEGVVHKDVAERGILLRELGIVLLLALVAAAVLEHHDFARGHLDAVKVVLHETDRSAHQLAHAHGNPRQRILRTAFALGRAAKVAHEKHRGAAVQGKAHGGNARHEAGFVRDAAFFIAGNVEIAANEDAASVELSGLRQSFESENLHESLTLRKNLFI